MKIKRIFIIILFFAICICQIKAQDTIVSDGYQIFKYPNGKIASEGTMRLGKPDGYWKNYYETGILKTEGNRLNFELDGVWKFYDDKGIQYLLINYKNGVYHGKRISNFKDRFIEDNFVNGIKQGESKEFYIEDSVLAKTTFYVDGLEDGISKEFAHDGRLIGISKYRNGFLLNVENFNALDGNGRKQGVWKEFYGNDELRIEGSYRNDLKHGYFKYYDETGKLVTIEKYIDGIEQKAPKELSQLELRTDYYPNGNIKTIGSYKDGVGEGVRREYDIDGNIKQAYILQQGAVTSKGIIDASGQRQGPWEDYYLDGALMAKGEYKDNQRIGEWKFYHPNGQLEQIGTYDKKGYSTGLWKWYFDNGKLRREESFLSGVADGEMTEYDSEGNIILKGVFTDGVQEGQWISQMRGYKEEGNYLNGVRDGEWNYYFPSGQKYFIGKFIDDYPDGTHTWFNKNGTISITGDYVMGLKEDVWKYYDEEGTLFLTIKYKNGVEIEYNSIRIMPETSTNNR